MNKQNTKVTEKVIKSGSIIGIALLETLLDQPGYTASTHVLIKESELSGHQMNGLAHFTYKSKEVAIPMVIKSPLITHRYGHLYVFNVAAYDPMKARKVVKRFMSDIRKYNVSLKPCIKI